MKITHLVAIAALAILPGLASAKVDFEKIDSPTTQSVSIYSVKVASPTESGAADRVKLRAESLGYAPISIVEKAPYFQVRAGQFDNYPDADELKDDMAANGFSGTSVLTTSNSEGLDSLPCPLTGKGNRLGVAALPPAATLGGPEVESVIGTNIPAPVDLENREDFDAVAREMKSIFHGRPDTDPVKGYALYYFALANERTGEDSDRDMAFDLYKRIALGKIASPAGYRIKAVLQAADIVHYTEENHADAYRLYKLILASDWLSGEARAEIEAELSGTVHELMDHHKEGTPADVRHELKEIYARIPEEYRKPRATVELIDSMTWFWERDNGGLPKARAHSLLIEEKYPDVPAVRCQAVWNEAVALERMGKVKEGRDAAEKAVRVYIDPADAFRSRLKSWNMEKRISGLLARLEKKLGNTKASEGWTEYSDAREHTTPPLQMRVPGMK